MIVISKAQTFECSMFQFCEKSKAIVFCNEKMQVIHEIKNCIQKDYDNIAYQAGGYPPRAIDIRMYEASNTLFD